jgi:hypothetical protein
LIEPTYWPTFGERRRWVRNVGQKPIIDFSRNGVIIPVGYSI